MYAFVLKSADWEIQHDIQVGRQSRKTYLISTE